MSTELLVPAWLGHDLDNESLAYKRHQSASPVDIENERMIGQVVRDRYCCPNEFLSFRIAGELSSAPRYFEFGPETIGYGRIAEGNMTRGRHSRLFAFSKVAIDHKEVRLPFDPDEVVWNLLLERYAAGQWGSGKRALKKAYYGLRPFMGGFLRKQVQKFYAGCREQPSFPHWPVDTSVDRICENLLTRSIQAGGVDCVPFVWFWPKGARGCVLITHDVETEKGRDLCAGLLDVDDAFGIRSSFQIVPEDRYDVTPQFLDEIRQRGFEICVQDLNHDGRLFDDRQEFLRRVTRINRYGREYGANGFRAAVLYRKPEWYADLEFSYDMSIPNVAHLDPQRGGCCTVMPYFIGDILELPITTVQDYTLFHLMNERTIDVWKLQLEMILACNGMASFIVHPDYVGEPATRSVYQELLGWLRKLAERQPLWFALPSEIDRWWRARQKMSVVRDGESWRIVGEDADRAVLAFAKTVDGQLRYELAGMCQGTAAQGTDLRASQSPIFPR